MRVGTGSMHMVLYLFQPIKPAWCIVLIAAVTCQLAQVSKLAPESQAQGSHFKLNQHLAVVKFCT